MKSEKSGLSSQMHPMSRSDIEQIVRKVTQEYFALASRHEPADGSRAAPVANSSSPITAAANSDTIKGGRPDARLFHTPEAEAVKNEICAVGRKLWSRQYVDGNGGNISCRIGSSAVICTPTLISKADVTPEDLCMVDLYGEQIAGARCRTSEVLLHLEIYRAVPEARAVVHCHPPHATAYAITGRVPPRRVIPEFEVFIGQAALAPYQTPGTPEFARSVLPFVKEHNTVLLANHGIVCWADTVTHAEWYAEILDTYCWTLMQAAQLGAPLSFIPPEKSADLLAIKKRLGLPDPRFNGDGARECQTADGEAPGGIALLPGTGTKQTYPVQTVDLEGLIASITEAVMKAVSGR